MLCVVESNAQLEIDSQLDDLLGQPMVIKNPCLLNNNNEQRIEQEVDIP